MGCGGAKADPIADLFEAVQAILRWGCGMIRRNPMMALAGVVASLVALDLILLLSGYRLLIREDRTPAVETTLYEPMRYDTLECSYFTGRSVQSFEDGNYRPRSIDECPFTFRPVG